MSPSLSGLRQILNPRTVAIIGASTRTEKFGGRVMNHVLKHGFGGQIIPINPGAGEIRGIVAYANIRAAPGPIDVALLAVPAEQVADALSDCGKAGVKGCVILTADFAEASDEGSARQRELLDIARAHGMRLIGPNCLGYINPGIRLALTSSVALAAQPMRAGAIGLVSQSGSLMASLISHAHDHGAGFSAAVSVGNQADLEICDFIEYFLDDDATRAICAYIEGIKDAPRFLRLAASCREAGKPLLAVKAGRSEAGGRIARSHTASLAGSDAIWWAACREHAVVLLDDPEALIYCADFLIRFGIPRGDGVAALSPSGGTIAVTADRMAAAGLRLAQLSDTTRRALGEIVPPNRPLNPLDIGGFAHTQSADGARRCHQLLANDPDVSAILIVVATTPQLEAKVHAWAEISLACGKPTAFLFTPGSLVEQARSALRERGCPYTNRMDDALRVLRSAIDYGKSLRIERETPVPPANFGAVAGFSTPAPQLTEYEAKALLQLAGIATTRDRLAGSEDQAVSAAREIRYPVALKLVSRALSHKSDAGGVKLDLADDAQLRSAWQEIAGNVACVARDEALECSVQPMVKGGVEIMVGTRWDTQFGAVVLVGAGGIWAETLRDTQMALAPVTPAHALELIAQLRIWPLLAGGRGQAPADVDALADVIARASWLAIKLGPRLVELDINPLLVKPTGVVALDARASFSPAAA